MRKICLLLTVLTAFAVSAQAQTAEDSVKATINALFSAMKSSDGDGVKNVFADSAVLQTLARSKDGKLIVRNESVAAFVESIGKLPKNAADERIEFGVVKIDGPLASVWTPYKFYYNGQFSHCGANSFQLIRVEKGWKIQYLIDTRRRQGCE